MDELIEKISKESGFSKEDILARIKNKLDELDGLVSKEGAAHIVASELGVKTLDLKDKETKIADVVPNRNHISLNGKVRRIFEVKEFETEKGKGKVCNVILEDETGTIKLVLWNDYVNLIEKIKEKDILRIESAFSKEGFNKSTELGIGMSSKILINPEKVEVKEFEGSYSGASFSGNRTPIQELKDGQVAEVRAAIVQKFEPYYYDSCPECGKKTGSCEHKKEPVKRGILSFFIDDGTGVVRATVFGDLVDVVMKKGLGEEILARGKVRYNQQFDQMELSVNALKEVDIEKEIETLSK